MTALDDHQVRGVDDVVATLALLAEHHLGAQAEQRGHEAQLVTHRRHQRLADGDAFTVATTNMAERAALGGEHLIIDGQDVDAVAFGLGHTSAGHIAATLFGIDQLIEKVDGAHQDGGVALVVVMPSVRHAYLGHAVRPSVRNVAIRTRDA